MTTTAAALYALANHLLTSQGAAAAAVNAAGGGALITLPTDAITKDNLLLRPQTERQPVGELQLTLTASAPRRARATATRVSANGGEDAVELEVRAAVEVPLGVGYATSAPGGGGYGPDDEGLLTLAGLAWGDLLARLLVSRAAVDALAAQALLSATTTLEIHDWIDSARNVAAVSVIAEVVATYQQRQGYGS